MSKQKKGKRSSMTQNARPRPTVHLPADQQVPGRYGDKSIWTGKSYIAVPMGRG